MNDSKRASGVAAQPARKRLIWAHVACGANLALESAGDLGEALHASVEFPGSPGMQTRLSRRVFALWGAGVAASRKWSRARSGFRAQRERAPGWRGEQPSAQQPFTGASFAGGMRISAARPLRFLRECLFSLHCKVY